MCIYLQIYTNNRVNLIDFDRAIRLFRSFWEERERVVIRIFSLRSTKDNYGVNKIFYKKEQCSIEIMACNS